MEAIDELLELSDAMRQGQAVLADEDLDENSTPVASSRRSSTFLNVVALGNVGAGKSAVLNSLIGHPVLPTGENGATRAPISVDLQRDSSLSSKSIILQIDNKSQQVSASALRHSLQDRLSKSTSGRSRDEIYLKLRTSTAPPLKLIDLPGLDQCIADESMLSEYAEHNDAILLVIIPASQAPEVASSKALRAVKEYDGDGTRTVGVISKIDQAASDPKALAAVQALLLNQGPSRASDIPWVALIGQSVSIASAQSGYENSLETAWRAESESLKSILTGAPQSKLGRIALVDALAQQIRSRMKVQLPNLLSGNMENWQIVHVPDNPRIPPDQLPTVDVIASLIDPKVANTLVRRLNQIAQLENLRHVKRVHKKFVQGRTQLSVILSLASENGNPLDNIPHDVQELMNSYQLSPFITKVCKYAALSKEEWEAQCKLWPTSYHPPTYNIDGITGFGEEDSESVFDFMKYAIQLAKSGDKMVVNAAVIVDPSDKQVIATACDQTCCWYTSANNTTLETYCFKTEASVSQSKYDGVLSYEALHPNSLPHYSKQLYTGVCCLYPWRWADQQSDTNSCSWHPLRHAAIVAVESSAARDIHLFPSLGKVQDKYAETDHPLPSSQVNDEGSSSLPVRPYLCTSFDIYLAWEPCIMCAMALVHQRIRRIFFAFPNPNAGALGTVHRLQGERSLNHHYAVFRVMVPEEVLSRDETVAAKHT